MSNNCDPDPHGTKLKEAAKNKKGKKKPVTKDKSDDS